MAYTGNPNTSPIDEIRLRLGDIDDEFPIMGDSEYQYFITKFPPVSPNTISNQAILGAAQSLLFYTSRYTRERAGMIEVYGAEAFQNYLAALKLLLANPSQMLNINAIPFFGGLSRIDSINNRANPDLVNAPFYRGETNNRPVALDRKPQVDRSDTEAAGFGYNAGEV